MVAGDPSFSSLLCSLSLSLSLSLSFRSPRAWWCLLRFNAHILLPLLFVFLLSIIINFSFCVGGSFFFVFFFENGKRIRSLAFLQKYFCCVFFCHFCHLSTRKNARVYAHALHTHMSETRKAEAEAEESSSSVGGWGFSLPSIELPTDLSSLTDTLSSAVRELETKADEAYSQMKGDDGRGDEEHARAGRNDG